MPVNGKRIILLGTLFPMLSAGVLAQSEEIETLDTTVVQSASEELKQAQGVSIITEEDFKRRPVTNDIAEIVRTMPGINLTGNSSSGQYGNKRQIDIRGMGPENTLILIDGKRSQIGVNAESKKKLMKFQVLTFLLTKIKSECSQLTK